MDFLDNYVVNFILKGNFILVKIIDNVTPWDSGPKQNKPKPKLKLKPKQKKIKRRRSFKCSKRKKVLTLKNFT